MVLSQDQPEGSKALVSLAQEREPGVVNSEVGGGLQLGGIGSRVPRRPGNPPSRGSVDDKIIPRKHKREHVKKEQREDCDILPSFSSSSEESVEETSDDEVQTDLRDADLIESASTYDSTGKTNYRQACEMYGVVPISNFLRNMNSAELSLMHYGLGPQGAKAISVSLITNTTVVKLNLKDNWLEAVGAKAIAEMLKENCYITDVDLSDNQLGTEGAKAISTMLMENTVLLRIVLSGNNFDDYAAKYLSEPISNPLKLQILNLSHNRISNAVGNELGNAIAENAGLKELNLSWNYLRGKGCIGIAEGLRDNIFLRVLDLSYNGFGNEGAKALGEALKVNNVLEHLNISNNRISAEGAVLLSLGLKANFTLMVLKMARNPMRSAGCYGILKAIKENPKSAIKSLDFSDIRVNNDFEDLFNSIKDQAPNLEVKHEGNVDRFKKSRSKADPLTKLKEYMKENHLQLEDFLDAFDLQANRRIRLHKFQEGLKNARVPLNDVEQQKLMDLLDKGSDGEIDFSTLKELLLCN
ncbi:leucine-rich repeat-containing protein 74B isoform X2 [Narcine bancroftii]|uniref:leucine-rich repeat-containing protein 74B isoform X2 n=1 Tax=Narcine bancroftii TaxID=1343680 RepID=UPI003831CA3D